MTEDQQMGSGSDPALIGWPARVLRCAVEDPDPEQQTAWHWISRAFAFGAVCHLLLWDAWQWSWLPGDIALGLGAVILVWRGALAGWLLSAVGVAWPLLFGYDQLTQSMIMLVWSLSAVAGLSVDQFRRDSGPTDGAAEPGDGLWGAIRAIQTVTALTYAIAVLHKLNAGFFHPTYSCAVYGFEEIVRYWQLDWSLPAWFNSVAPFVILAGEGSIAVSLLLRRHRLAWCIAVPFHLALTFTMAPAFGFVMSAGHIAYATEDDRRRLRAWTLFYWPLIAAGALTACAFSVWAHGRAPSITMSLREIIAWAVWIIVWGALGTRPTELFRAIEPKTGGTATKVILGTACLVFAFNGITPYLGLQYQHAGAMVSNLRIDRGCWNSLVVPESVRLRDPYIRVEEVYMGRPGRVPYYEDLVRNQLWHPPEIRQMRTNWCDERIRPFYLEGTYFGEAFRIEDLCAGEPLPFGETYLGDWAVFGRSFRFQKNLQRGCPQDCIH